MKRIAPRSTCSVGKHCGTKVVRQCDYWYLCGREEMRGVTSMDELQNGDISYRHGAGKK